MYKRPSALLAVFGLAVLVSGCCSGPCLLRHVAEFRFGPEQVSFVTVTGPPPGDPGTLIYTKSFALPANQPTVFVTLSTTGDTHGGAASWFSALVNGTPCNRGNEGAGFAPSGWIPLQKHFDGGAGGDGGGGPGDMHDNGIYYTWCCREGVRPGTNNTVEIRMASSIAGTPVFVERSHYYVDSVKTRLCTEAARIPGEFEALKALRSKLPPGHQEHLPPPD